MDGTSLSSGWKRAVQAFLFANVCFYVYLGYDAVFERPKREAARQLQIDTFYRVHKCRPEGYISNKYGPIRTYRCDNGLYIAEDMK